MIKKILRGALGVIGILVLCFVLFPLGQVEAADGDNYFWIAGTGNWSDYANHWSKTSGNVGGEMHGAAPNSTNNVYFDANSDAGGAWTVTVDAAANCKDMIWTGAENSPALVITFKLGIHGSLTLIPAMTMSGAAGLTFSSTTTGKTITTAGKTISSNTDFSGVGGGWTLQDDYLTSVDLYVTAGALDTNGKALTSRRIVVRGGEVKALTLGASVINLTGVAGGTLFFEAGYSNFTLNSGTSVINSGGGIFDGGGYTFYIVNLTGATSTITGSNTFNTLGLTRADVQTITFTDGTTQTVTNFTRNAGTQLKTLQGSGVAGWAITKAGGGTAYMDYISVSRSTGSPASTFIAGVNSTNGGDNTDWSFVADVTTGAETNVTFGAATLNGTVTTNGTNATRRGFQYGKVSGALNLDVHSDGSYGTGAYSFNIVGLSQNDTYYYRAYAVTEGVTEYGAEGSLNTQPTAWGIMMLLPLIVAIGVVIIGLRVLASSGMQGYAVSVLFGVATYIMLQALIGIL